MANILYKTLFSVQLLHEYFVINNDGSTLFEGNFDKDAFLLDRFNNDVASISNSFLYEVPQVFESSFKGYHLHIIPTYTGFSIMCRVLQEKLADGTVTYKPFLRLPDNLNIPVQLTLRNSLLNAVSDRRIKSAIPAAYYFTNEDILSTRTFPTLSAAIPPFDPEYTYEQGELYVNDQNKLCLFYMAGNTPSFLPVKGNSYANARDELVVPPQFTYSFSEEDAVTSSQFQLNDNTGKTIRNYAFKTSNPVKKVTINFRFDQLSQPDQPLVPLLTLPGSSNTAENVYTLVVTVNGVKVYTHKLIFFEVAGVVPCWAVVSIRPKVANSDFNIYDSNGLIKYRKQADGSEVSAPVFEIRLKSRSTFWRYINDKNGKLKLEDNDPFLEKAGNNLVTKLPRPASYLTTAFKNTNDQTLHYLPNPESNERIIIEGKKAYTDVRVPKSKMFPLEDTS